MKRILLLWITCFLLVGCAQPQIVDENRIVHVAGFDTEGKSINGTILYPEYTHGVETKPQMQSTTAQTFETITSHLSSESPYKIVLGQMSTLLFGKSVAQNGISDIVENLLRNPDIGRDVQLAVVDGSAEKLLNNVVKNDSLYLTQLIEQNIKNESIPRTNLHVFLYDYFSFLSDPFVPHIQKKEQGSVAVTGLAFFKEDKVVMYVNQQDAFLVKLLVTPTQNGRYEMTLKKEGKKGTIVIQNLLGGSTFYVTQDGASPNVKITLQLDGLIEKAPAWINLTKKKDILYIKRQLEKTLEKKLLTLARRFQEKEIDPLGIREEIRSRSRKWDSKQIRNMYPSISITVKAKVNVVQSGIGE
ncbi:hypothetical protein BAMA_23945 [Bacillus manliponensis]|uniref:Uncharacterized protein n=1 Tax=Bacillus manliponensis TaxID=574376 RepID=A0A073JVN2_9BACI|nr:Ger(x)C family spore germination protein [Bacillus manliponensis]KEK19069.1 hypothetical protein BAMA_23945 [Bacillus manliponensis]